MLLENKTERHNTHALSSNSSSNNHSYDFDIKNKNNKNKNQKEEENTSFNSQLNYIQINKINTILNKYNLIPHSNRKNSDINKLLVKEKDEKENTIIRKSFFAKNQKSILTNSDHQSTQKIKKKKNVQINNQNYNQSNSNSILNNIVNTNSKEKSEDINNNNNINSNNYLKNTETTKSENKIKNKKKEVIYAISYKNANKETRFNNIQKYIEDEKKIQNKKGTKKNKLIIYQQMPSSKNLLRSINKPQISFITKIYKNYGTNPFGYDMFSGMRLNVKNNLCFFTKKIIRQEEFYLMEKQLKIQKYEQLKKEVEEEKIPTFSSINTSSSNSSTDKKKQKIKGKTKSKSKKKPTKHKTKIKPKNFSKKKNFLPKYDNKPIRSISIHSRFSNEKSEERKTISSRTKVFQKIPNIKKTNSKNCIHRKVIGVNNYNKNSRKYSIMTRLHEKYFNKNGNNSNRNKIASSSSLRNINNNFRNNLLNINKNKENKENKDKPEELEEEKDKNNNSAIKDKDKEINEIDFKKFLE